MEQLNKQERHKLVHERLSQLAMRMSELFNWELDGEQSEAYKSTQEYYMQLQTDAMYIDFPQPHQRHTRN